LWSWLCAWFVGGFWTLWVAFSERGCVGGGGGPGLGVLAGVLRGVRVLVVIVVFASSWEVAAGAGVPGDRGVWCWPWLF
jgi:hypothetical protein